MNGRLEKGYIGLSFDDGRIDNYTIVYPLLKKYNIPATFNITTGYIKGDKDAKPTDVKPMTVNMVKEFGANPLFEIAGHGYYHRNDIDDIKKGFSELKEILKVKTLTPDGDGFASPGTGLSQIVWQKLGSGRGDVKYARVSLRYLNHVKLKTFIRKASRVLKWPVLYRLAYQDTLMNNMQDGILYSVPVLSSITNSELEALIKYAAVHKKALVLMFHSIVPKGQIHDNWDFEENKFEKLLLFIQEMQSKELLDVLTSMEISKRLK